MSKRSDSGGWYKDGNLSFADGVDSSLPPNTIGRTQVAMATNTSFRNGVASPRYGLVRHDLSFDPGVAGDPDVASGFKTPDGKFQTADFYDNEGRALLLSSHGGRQFAIDPVKMYVREITPGVNHADRNAKDIDLCWSVQAENYWILQDNNSQPILFDGGSAVRADPALKQVPVGNVMCYTMGRLAVALSDRQSYRIGDLVFGPSGTPTKFYRDAMLFFTENDYLNEGGDFVARVFGAPSNTGPITSMRAVSMADTQLGQGPLMVGQPYNVFTVSLPFDRTTWKNMSQPIQTVTPVSGPTGQRSTVLVNTDMWYRSLEGCRSYIMARREMQTAWGMTSNSAELGELLGYDTPWLLEYGSGVFFDNRLLQTVSPAMGPRGVWHRGLVTIDFNVSSSMRHPAPPAWEGVWSKSELRILQILKGMVQKVERCFIYALNASNEIELWELVPSLHQDDNQADIPWSIDFPSYNCGDNDQLKRLETARAILRNVQGTVSGTLKYRTDQSGNYLPWDTFSVCATVQDCGTPQCAGPANYLPQQRSPIRFRMPPDTFQGLEGDSSKARCGYEFQPRLELTGWAQLEQFRIFAKDEPETLGITNKDPSPCQGVTDCPPGPFYT